MWFKIGTTTSTRSFPCKMKPCSGWLTTSVPSKPHSLNETCVQHCCCLLCLAEHIRRHKRTHSICWCPQCPTLAHTQHEPTHSLTHTHISPILLLVQESDHSALMTRMSSFEQKVLLFCFCFCLTWSPYFSIFSERRGASVLL